MIIMKRFFKRFNILITVITFPVLTSGCSLVPDFEMPSFELPSFWNYESEPENISSKEIDLEWWKEFGDDNLNKIMQEALDNNNDLRSSIARINQSRASLKIKNASLFPDITGAASSSTSRTETSSSNSSSNSFTSGVDVSYQLDLFGSESADRQSAQASLKSTEFRESALRLTVLSDTANAYFNLISSKERLDIANENLQSAKYLLEIVQSRFDVGRLSYLELSQQKSAYASVLAARASAEENLKNAENSLSILLGKLPTKITTQKKSLDAIRVPTIATGLPSELLQRRPDIAEDEQDLIAANANIGIARAALFPSINLTSGADISAASLGGSATNVLSAASSLSVPIFKGGSIFAELDRVKERQNELIENYRKTVITAFREVEDAIAAVRSNGDRERQLRISKEEAEKSYDLSLQLFEAGSIDFQNLLDSQRSMLTARDSYSQAKLSRLTAAVSLYKALGGGFRKN